MTKVQYTVTARMKLWFGLLLFTACDDPIVAFVDQEADGASTVDPETETVPRVASPAYEPPQPVELRDPVDLWENGGVAGRVDGADAMRDGYFVLDLGEEWTPYLFTEGGENGTATLTNDYRETFLALARGEFSEDQHGTRAERDKYLELYGIPPTLGLLRERFEAIGESACVAELDLEPLRTFDDVVTFRRDAGAMRRAEGFPDLERDALGIAQSLGVSSPNEVDRSALSRDDAETIVRYLDQAPTYRAIAALQDRLRCEGYFENRGAAKRGFLDLPTHEALADFERRHRVIGWGFLSRDTLRVARLSPLEAEREDVIRVLAERAMHAAGVIEDGSVESSYRGADGRIYQVRNLESELREAVIAAFGLSTPESTLAFLRGLGELSSTQRVAIPAPELPEYYSSNMDLRVEVDRGDVWYEFPYDENGNERAQPVTNRPRTTIAVVYRGQQIPIARFGTTIGGWRSESVDANGTIMYRYKNSPDGEFVWHQIVAAPVWLPPPTTPARDLLVRHGGGYRVNYHETGPSYASAYGLVAAYHAQAEETDDGYRVFGDEGIRSHGSVDYTSIMRRHSHGCHRLLNHIAVRLMSFALARRPHERVGQQHVNYGLDLLHNGETYRLHIDQGGYVFRLNEPLPVTVLTGRIMGEAEAPIEHPMPRYDREAGGYFDAGGARVTVDRLGNITVIEPAPETETPTEDESDSLVGETELSDTARAILEALPPEP